MKPPWLRRGRCASILPDVAKKMDKFSNTSINGKQYIAVPAVNKLLTAIAARRDQDAKRAAQTAQIPNAVTEPTAQ
jgi:hypothetical protein